MNITEINNELKTMGYTPFVTRIEKPNYYRVEDHTIVRLYPLLMHLTISATQNQSIQSIQLNIQNVVSTYVSPQLHGNISTRTYSQEELQQAIDRYDMHFDILEENLTSKWILNVKTTLSQISKTKLFNNLGEPIYLITTALIPKIKPKDVYISHDI